MEGKEDFCRVFFYYFFLFIILNNSVFFPFKNIRVCFQRSGSFTSLRRFKKNNEYVQLPKAESVGGDTAQHIIYWIFTMHVSCYRRSAVMISSYSSSWGSHMTSFRASVRELGGGGGGSACNNENHMEGGVREKEREWGERRKEREKPGSSCNKDCRTESRTRVRTETMSGEQRPEPPTVSESIRRKNSSKQVLQNLIR